MNGRWAYLYRAIDEAGQVVDVCCSERRNAAAAGACFARAVDETGVTPTRLTTDRAKCYPPALRATLPGGEHRSSRYRNNGLERDHSHLKQLLRPMRGCNRAACAGMVSRGHGLLQNLRNGFSAVTAAVPRALRLASAWPRLAAMI